MGRGLQSHQSFWALFLPKEKSVLKACKTTCLKYVRKNTVIKLIHYFKYSKKKKSCWMMKFQIVIYFAYRKPAMVHPYTIPHSMHTVQTASLPTNILAYST